MLALVSFFHYRRACLLAGIRRSAIMHEMANDTAAFCLNQEAFECHRERMSSRARGGKGEREGGEGG